MAVYPTVQLKLLPGGQLPTRATEGSVGYDLYARLASDRDSVAPWSEERILPGEHVRIPVGFALALPHGYEAQIRPRSGLYWNRGVSAQLGTVDSDFRGEMTVVLTNHSDTEYWVAHGERIAQMVINRVELPTLQVVDQLDETARGERGFGSTGQ